MKLLIEDRAPLSLVGARGVNTQRGTFSRLVTGAMGIPAIGVCGSERDGKQITSTADHIRRSA
jgi:hypothetical protein